MMLEEKIAMAQTIRGRDRFGPVSPEELAALPGTETELHIPVEGGASPSMSTRSDRTICRKRQHWSSISTAAASSRGAPTGTAVTAAPSWSG